ncbi:MAG: DivIVA domain-containing protein [Oscillospiraceae bacterium]|nr:DivIVA domain-containing protein [Oscillospiraceae bacterium]
MLSLNDIKNKKFQKASLRGGYMREEVDDFLDEVETSYDALIQKTAEQHDHLQHEESEIRQLQNKVKEQEDQIQQYCQEEDEIKEALVSAQKMRDASIRDARQQAEKVVNDAQLKAKEIVENASLKIEGEAEKLSQMKQAVSDFRSNLLNLYKEHITLINDLPHQEAKKVSEEAEQKTADEQPAAEKNASPDKSQDKEDLSEEAEDDQPKPVTFASEDGKPNYPTAKPFDPVKPENASKKPAGFADDYDFDETDTSEIFSKKH